MTRSFVSIDQFLFLIRIFIVLDLDKISLEFVDTAIYEIVRLFFSKYTNARQ